MAYNGFQNEVVPLSVAQLASANSSPPVVIAVPSGKIAQVLSAAMIRTAGTVQVSNLNLRYADTEINALNSHMNMGGVSMRRASDGFEHELLATINGKDVVLWGEFDNTGAIATATINDGGTGWSVNNTMNIGAFGATGRVTAQSGGVVTAVEILIGGSGYAVGQTINTDSGAGFGLILDVATITPANSSGILSVCYQLIPV